MSTIITRQLLEHYLKATGAPPRQGEDWSDVSRSIVAIAQWEGVSVADLAARLGLCAAAEALLYVDIQSSEARVARRNSAERLLRMAHVDPRRWEETRV